MTSINRPRAGLFVLGMVCAAFAAPAQTSSTFDVSGTWKTRFGPVTLVQQGKSVTGTFVWKEVGEFTGRVEGVWLTGRWRTTSGSGSGTWRLEIITGANRLAGKSTSDGDGEVVNFDAVRAELLTQRPSSDIAPAESNSPEGSISGSWAASLGEFTLRQEGELVTGLFDWDGGGRLTGRRDGDGLQGEWYGRDGMSSGLWNARISENGRLLVGIWFDDAAGVQDWTARRADDPGEPDGSDSPSAPSVRHGQAFTGEWRSRFGNFRLTVALHIVTGRFEWDGGGTFSGTVVDNTASGTWLSQDGSKTGRWTLQSLPGGRILQGQISTTKPEPSSKSWTAVRNK